MNKKLLTLSACALMSASALAQDLNVSPGSKKWDADFDQLIAGQTVHRIGAKGTTSLAPESLQDVIVNVTGNASEVIDFVSAEGYEATLITDKCFTATIPARFVATLAERDDVVYISASRQAHLFMKSARSLTKADAVHSGTDLDTPFDGTGVVVGIIDEGFQYNHIAFADRASYYTGTRFSTSLPTKGDSYSTSAHGHATHVTNIAAGAKVDDNPYYGMAPNAEILMASSSFTNSDVLKQAKAIKNYAEDAGKPWVINMSFGSNEGPHDGTTAFDKNMSALCGEGGIMVAAMGNDGSTSIHGEADFDEDEQVKSLYIKPSSSNSKKGFVVDLWSKNATGKKDLTIEFIIKTSSKEYKVTSTQLRSAGFSTTDEVSSLNKKQHYYVGGYTSQLATVLGITNSTYYIVLKVTGNTGDGYHAWLCGTADDTDAEFGPKLSSLSDYNVQKGNDDYLVGQGAASIPKALAVGSINANVRFTNLSGATYTTGVTGAVGDISYFSSPGPSVDADQMKPACVAPGGGVISAFNSSDTNVKDNATDVVAKVTSDSKSYYYGLMSGTSMASPAVTGIVALWLQANPKLTYEQILSILKETSTTDSKTGTLDERGWNATSGYGKINAYEGLKKALELAKTDGINETLNTTTPVTLQKNADNWKVLFNNDESYADIRIYNVNGQQVAADHIDNARRGDEHVVKLTSLPAGVYVFSVATKAANVTRKMVVK